MGEGAQPGQAEVGALLAQRGLRHASQARLELDRGHQRGQLQRHGVHTGDGDAGGQPQPGHVTEQGSHRPPQRLDIAGVLDAVGMLDADRGGGPGAEVALDLVDHAQRTAGIRSRSLLSRSRSSPASGASMPATSMKA